MSGAIHDVNDEADDVFLDELKPGTKLMFGQYTIVSFLNAGGFGITYNAKDSLDRKIVIKECFPGAFCRRSRYLVNARSRAHQTELQSIVRLFVQEAKSLAKLNHPNIVGVHNVFEENNTAYMALEFIDGRDLLDIIEDEKTTIPPEKIRNILRETLGAIGFVHEKGILHRDISPDNILVDDNMRPTLIDFGAAREEAANKSRVLSALRVVKDGYSPQEFYIQGSDQGPFSDLYALAASFYHLLTGEVPPNSQARLSAIATGNPDPYVPVKGTIPELDENFLAALDKALNVLPKDRVQSAEDWIAMIDGTKPVVSVDAANIGAKPKAAAGTPAKAKRKTGMLFATTAVLAIVAGGFVVTQTNLIEAFTAETIFVDQEAPVIERAEAPTAAVVAPTQPETPEVVAATPAVTPEALDTFEAVAALAAVQTTADAAAVIASNNTTIEAPEPLVAPEIDEVATTPVVEPTTPAIDEAAIQDPAPVLAEEPVAPEVVAEGTDEPALAEAEPVVEVATSPEQSVDAPVVVDEPAETASLPVAVAQPETPEVAAEPATQVTVRMPESTDTADTAIAAVAPQKLPAAEAQGQASDNAGDATATLAVLPYDGLFTVQQNETRIYAVNGRPVETADDFQTILRDSADLSKVTEVTATVSTGTVGVEGLAEQEWALPLAEETMLLNGVKFRAVPAADGWITTVTEVPTGVATDLQVGDQILGYFSTNEPLKTRDAMAVLFEREMAAGTTMYNFTVKRDDSTWVASLTYEMP